MIMAREDIIICVSRSKASCEPPPSSGHSLRRCAAATGLLTWRGAISMPVAVPVSAFFASIPSVVRRIMEPEVVPRSRDR